LLPERALAAPIALRWFETRDAPTVRLLAGEREVAEMTALVPHPYPEGAAEAWLALQARELAAGRAYAYAITTSEDGILVGAVDLRPAPSERESLGYWIGRPYWGRGYATAATRAIIALAFCFLDVESLTASHLVRNPASGRVLEKCGMRRLRTETRDHRGAPDVFCVRGISREAWEGVVAEADAGSLGAPSVQVGQ
jgi:RimJ/RimL family protein N-acetyltransferase